MKSKSAFSLLLIQLTSTSFLCCTYGFPLLVHPNTFRSISSLPFSSSSTTLSESSPQISIPNSSPSSTDKILQNDALNSLKDMYNDTIIKKDNKITKQYQYPLEGYNLDQIIQYKEQPQKNISNDIPQNHQEEEIKEQLKKVLKRNQMSDINVTLPVALLLLNPIEYPTLSRARRDIRKGSILISSHEIQEEEQVIRRGKTDDRIYPLDIIAKQVYMSEKDVYDGMVYDNPNILIGVMYEDDHIAVINKPAGIPIIASRKDGHRRHTVQAALPFMLRPPSFPTDLRYPHHCHRLDIPTSGLLVVAKTKPALVAMSKRFERHEVNKTYTAIINGIPNADACTPLTSILEPNQMGIQLDNSNDTSWNIITSELENKTCITLWRTIQTIQSMTARNNTLTKVELKLKTGRYHQLRRHMAWVLKCPIIGDTTYEDSLSQHHHISGYGLLLCSNRIQFLHPMYDHDSIFSSDAIDISIDLPEKFTTLTDKEDRLYYYYNNNNREAY